MDAKKKKGVYIGLGIVALVGVVLYARHKNSTSSAAATTNPNLLMVSSANTNVNGYQNSSYLQALSAEAYLSKQLSGMQTQPGSVGTPTTTTTTTTTPVDTGTTWTSTTTPSAQAITLAQALPANFSFQGL